MKKLFIQICKLFGLELIDQNRFTSPTLNKELSQDLSILNEKSIILPLGEVKITRKIKSILIIIRLNTEIEISGMTAGPNVKNSEAIIIVEGRNDVRNLLKFGIKNAIATMGSGIDPELVNMAKNKKIVTLTAVQPQGRYGALSINENLLVEEFVEKPTGDGSWINGGFFVCSKAVFEYFDAHAN